MDLVDFEGNHQYAKFRSFRVAGEAEQYKLDLGAFVEGNAGACPCRAAAWLPRGRGEPWARSGA